MSGLYNPSAFRVEDPAELARLMQAMTFATLITGGDDVLRASHLPFLLDAQAGPRGTLRGHLALANEHCQALDGRPALVVFQAGDHYVTPSWYASKLHTARVVPTWNYVTVHARGVARTYRDPARLRGLVEALTIRMEGERPEPWHVDDAPADYVERLITQIVGVDVALDDVEGKVKLGQNRDGADRASLAAGLERERPSLWHLLEALRPRH